MVPDWLVATNLEVRFLLELGLLVVFAYVPWRTIRPRGARITASIALPVLVAIIWATVVHGESVPQPARLAVQIILFAAAVVSLAYVGRPRLAAAFALVALVNAGLMVLWSQ